MEILNRFYGNIITSVTTLRGADLHGASGIFSFGPIGKQKRICFAYKLGGIPAFRIGCFSGSEEEAVKAIREKYGAGSLYESQVRLAAKIAEDW